MIYELASRRLIPVPWDVGENVVFAPSGEVFVNGHNDGRFYWWDPRTGRSRMPSSNLPYVGGSVQFSPDGRQFATVDPSTHRIHLWSTETYELKREFSGHSVGPETLAFTPDGKTLACAGGDRMVKLWEVATGEELLTLEGFSDRVVFLNFAPDGRSLATMSSARKNQWDACLWRTADDEPEVAAPAKSN